MVLGQATYSISMGHSVERTLRSNTLDATHKQQEGNLSGSKKHATILNMLRVTLSIHIDTPDELLS